MDSQDDTAVARRKVNHTGMRIKKTKGSKEHEREQ